MFLRFYPVGMFNSPRLKKELNQLLAKPPIGIKVNIKEGSTSILEAGKNFIFNYTILYCYLLYIKLF